MNRNTILFFIMFLTSSLVCAEETKLIVFPKWMHGSWDLSAEDCKSEWRINGLDVSADRLNYWESFSSISKIKVLAETAIEVTLSESGEGSQWLSKKEFKLSSDKEKLLEINAEGKVVSRVSCEKDT